MDRASLIYPLTYGGLISSVRLIIFSPVVSGQSTAVGANNVDIERVASILDDDDKDDVGLGQIMLGMTRRNPPRP